jgi:hypothetical protein
VLVALALIPLLAIKIGYKAYKLAISDVASNIKLVTLNFNNNNKFKEELNKLLKEVNILDKVKYR